MKNDTIVAIATALGNSGISIIRISGSDALAIIDKIYCSKNKNKVLSKVESHTIHYGYIVDNKNIIDEVMVAIMKGPNSYTKEDVVEIDCHGGVMVTKKILETIIKNGARIAEPGEFTKRAFLNGRIDLSQAEAVMDVIQAKNEMALKSSFGQLKGNVSRKIKEIRKRVIIDVAFIEAALDDPEHISIDGFSQELLRKVNLNIEELETLLESSKNGKILKEGIKTVIIGKPNAGKSSLLNAFLGEERAIVTDIAGTTRDTLEETIQLGELVLNIVDTAGIRETKDIIEKIGVERATNTLEDADLIIYVVDGTKELDENDDKIMKMIENRKTLVLLNKVDLDVKIDKDKLGKETGKVVIEISAKNQEGIDSVEKYIKDMFFHGEIKFNDEIYITNVRHKEAIQNSMLSLQRVKKSIEDEMPEDFYTIDLMEAYEVLGEIIGESVGEDLVNTIFSEFCMGK